MVFTEREKILLCNALLTYRDYLEEDMIANHGYINGLKHDYELMFQHIYNLINRFETEKYDVETVENHLT